MRLEPGHVLAGDLFPEPMRIETVSPDGSDAWTLGLVGTRTERFSKVRLTKEQLARLTVRQTAPTYDGNGALLRLGVQAYALGIAYEFDPYFGLSISRVDPLPHQLEAVYEHMLHLPIVRFLLADDAGAGKTIMSGLLLRELKLRGLAERTLIVTPANLCFQWQREMRERFGEQFVVLRGSELRSQFGVNPWREHKQIITSLDLAKREDILPGLRQSHWDLVLIDEAHRMSASAEDKKSLRYKLGELLRDSTGHMVMLTATPHRGDPENFSLFLQLLDKDAFAHVRSIKEAMKAGVAPFYIRRTKEAMVSFPVQREDGTWVTKPLFTKRFVNTASFSIDGPEDRLYSDVTAFVKSMSRRAASLAEDDPRARATGFLMAMYQRRLASSTASLKKSLERRAEAVTKKLRQADEMAKEGSFEVPDEDDWEEMDEGEREGMEKKVEAVMLTQNRELVNWEVGELRRLAEEAQRVMDIGAEAKLARLKKLMEDEKFFERKDQRLLIFTEFKDTLEYLVEKLRGWGFEVGFIQGSMKPGSRDEPGSRLYVENQFREGDIQIMVATEAAGEGINLQFCHFLVNYDIPWNPNRLEQRMGRIHRYGQKEDCLIFNFVASNTVEGRVLAKLLEKLQEIRDALDSDSVFNVVGEVFPAAHIERIFREYYAGNLSDTDVEERILEPATEQRFRDICQNALEGLATKSLNIGMLVERRAKAQEKRLVPETIARFLSSSAGIAGYTLKPLGTHDHSFDTGPTPPTLRRFESREDWKLAPVAARYGRVTTQREVADEQHFEWVTPGHPLFEALRRSAWEASQEHLAKGACFYSLTHDTPARLDLYKARIVDGLGRVVHERMFGVEVSEGEEPHLKDPATLGDLLPAQRPADLPKASVLPEPLEFLNQGAFMEFHHEVEAERVAEVERVAKHVEVSLTELIAKEDEKVGRYTEEKDAGMDGAAGQLAQAMERQDELAHRREQRREQLAKQRHLTLQGVERVASVLILPHPDREGPELRNLRQDKETEAKAMEVATLHEEEQGRVVEDVHEQNLGYDLKSVHPESGELRLIEVKGLGADGGDILLTPNEHSKALDRRDCYWLYVVTGCKGPKQTLHDIFDPASKPWHAISKVQHFTLGVRELTKGGS